MSIISNQTTYNRLFRISSNCPVFSGDSFWHWIQDIYLIESILNLTNKSLNLHIFKRLSDVIPCRSCSLKVGNRIFERNLTGRGYPSLERTLKDESPIIQAYYSRFRGLFSFDLLLANFQNSFTKKLQQFPSSYVLKILVLI